MAHNQRSDADRRVIDLTGPTTRNVIVYGAGGHARVVIDVLEDMGFAAVAQLNDHAGRIHPSTHNQIPGIRALGADAFPPLGSPVVIAVGNNRERMELVDLLETVSGNGWPEPLRFVTPIHSTSTIAKTATIGEGTMVLHRAVVQPNSVVGKHVLINTAASVDHDNIIGDYAHISPHATLSGHVEVGEGTHIGAGATVIPSVKIGAWCTVGAGSVVLSDIPDGSTAVGAPARVIKNH